MASLADKAILSGADNCLLMLEKDMYDSWKSRIELYMLNRQHDRMILESVKHGPLLWPTVEEDGVTRLKKYFELSAAESIQADCDVKATNIILQALPPKIYALVITHKVAKDLWERIQLLMQGTSLTKQERECKLYDEFNKFAYRKGERLRDFYLRFSLLLNDINMYNMKLEQFQVNTKFLNTLPPEWSKFVTDVKLVRDLHTTNQQASTYQTSPYATSYHTPQFVSQGPSSSTHSISYLVTDTSSLINHNSYMASSSAPQINYALMVQHSSEFSPPKTRLVVPVFQKGDDPIDAINHMTSFLTVVVTLRYPTTNNQLRTSSNPRQQATINNGWVTIQPIQGRQNFVSAGLSRLFTSGSDCDEIKSAKIVLMANLSHYGFDNLAEIELSAEQAFWSQYSVQTDEPTLSATTTIVEVLNELLKVSMVNSCVKKLKSHLASFDMVVKERTTSTAITEGTWGFEHTKACFRDDIIPFVKALKELFTSFDQCLIDEVTELQNIFKQMELALEQHQQCDDLINKVNLKSAEVSDLNASLQEKVLVITALKEQLNKLKGGTFKLVGNVCPLTRIATPTIVPHREPIPIVNSMDKPVVTLVVQIVLWYLDSDCPKHMIGDRSQLVNFVQKFLGTVKFGNDHASKTKSWLWHRRLSHLNFGAINYLARQGLVRGLPKLKFEKDHICSACAMGKSTKKTHKPKSKDTNQEKLHLLHMDLCGPMRVKSVNGKKMVKCSSLTLSDWECDHFSGVEGLGHNLFSVGQFCDSDLEVAFRQHTCFICNLDGVDLLTGSQGNNLYTLSLQDMMTSSPICLLSKASKTKSWLWHRRLSHLNFDAINYLARQGLVRGLLKLKFEKDHLCSACAMGKSTKKTHKPKYEDTNQEKLYLLHMDLCGPMRVESVNGKKYILVIVDDYSRFTWVKFPRSKDETPTFIIKFLKMIQVRLNVPVRRIRTDNGTEFVNQTLRDYYEEVGISHETSVARSPQQNGVVERRNRILIEAAHTMLIYAQAPLFLWAEAVATACFMQNRSIIRLRHGKTTYELLHSKLLDLSFFHVFGALCYPINDSENLGKLQQKDDIRIFIGYAPTKKAFRIYNRRTRRIVETIHVDFDELTAMASEQSSSRRIVDFDELTDSHC
nr:retrovirus-related Pol polyprotein from transposon TNT 1-94 [Tanacetum cinerariifolium]